LRYLETPAAYYCHEPPRALHENAWQSHATRYERLRQSWRAPLERQLARRLAAEDTSLVRAASAVLTNSRYTQSRILSIYGVNATVCPPGVHTPEVDDAVPADSTYVLSVGALEPHKAFDFLIDALSLIPAATRPALHVVANDQNAGYRRVLQRKARAAGVELSIRFRIPDTELAREYAGAALFVFAAHDEPLGLSPLEAMSHGLAVLAVGEGGVRETVDDGVTGILTPRSPQYFAQRLYELLDSREYARQLGMRGRQRVQNDWSWQARGACLASHLEQIAQGAGREQVRLTR
ncbi:MAG TPA: glycosyltransferase family 4 protein, partial [Dehalococcoidia bacterium]